MELKGKMELGADFPPDGTVFKRLTCLKESR